MNRNVRVFLWVLICTLLLTAPALAADTVAEIAATQRAALKSFKLNYTSNTIPKGSAMQLAVSKAKPLNAYIDSTQIIWSSSAPKVASVSSDGVVIAHARGKATIKAKIGKKTASCIVTVKVPLSSITLNKTSLYSIVGKTHNLKVTAYSPKDTSSKKKAKWTSSAPAIAQVNSKGQVKLKKAGTARITCTIDGARTSCDIAVYKKTEYYMAEMIRLVNKERTKLGIAPVKMNDVLLGAAAVRAKEIVNYFSHIRPDGSSCFTVVKHGQSGSLGENIAQTSGVSLNSPASVMRMWMGSPDHRRNILDPAYSHFGVGIIKKGNRYYWVQIFSKTNH